ncbi:hypothetical protein NECAME_10652 [Necator americanus]|uniref:AB hydrolase-1 domain-containing protein n=1 Tax=Necator americanus TaxID=51031 RepID=W2T9T7_NECAM|nr:hypothetical protein NECAME_10652 [Necator americanus]ETN77976.1 hypothetical protein NECAME_10652 [Necator americanus]
MGTEQLTQFNNSRWDVVAGHLPSPSSALNLLHWAQVMRFHELRRLDHGKSRNMEIYGQEKPPMFNLSQITTPVFLFWSSDDTLAPAADVRNHIIKKLRDALKISMYPVQQDTCSAGCMLYLTLKPFKSVY